MSGDDLPFWPAAAPPASRINTDRLVAALVKLAAKNVPPDVQELLIHGDPMRSIPPGALDAALSTVDARAELVTALNTAVGHIEHMAAFLGGLNAGYSFESLGEDMPNIRAALGRSSSHEEALPFLRRR